MVSRQKCIHQVVATLLGHGSERAACEQQVQLADRIRFLGRLPPAQVPPLLQRSQAILLMSDFEGLPVALLEAMAAGVVPVVRIIDSGIPELVHHERTGLLVPNDPIAAARALVRLSEDPGLWQHCSEQARALMQSHYSADHCFERWLEVIGEPQSAEGARFPIATTGLGRLLPLADPRFRSQYPPPRSRWSRLHPWRLLGRLRRGAVRIMQPG